MKACSGSFVVCFYWDKSSSFFNRASNLLLAATIISCFLRCKLTDLSDLSASHDEDVESPTAKSSSLMLYFSSKLIDFFGMLLELGLGLEFDSIVASVADLEDA